jgi:periplasmic protein TonB
MKSSSMVLCSSLIMVMFGQGCATTVRIPPQARYQAKPQYPFEMRRAGISGEVVVQLIVDKEGIPRRVHAVRSSRKDFEAAAVAAVEKWRFKPGTADGLPVDTPMAVPIVFTQNEETP